MNGIVRVYYTEVDTYLTGSYAVMETHSKHQLYGDTKHCSYEMLRCRCMPALLRRIDL